MINYVLGDLLASDEKIIAHGCNAQGAFGSGVAGVIRKAYPRCYETYRLAHSEGKAQLGSAIMHREYGTHKTIANCITQEFYGPGDKVYVDYVAVKSALAQVAQYANQLNESNIAEDYKSTSIGVPMIGCGLAGGDWNTVKAIIEDVSNEYEIDFNVYIIDEMVYNDVTARDE